VVASTDNTTLGADVTIQDSTAVGAVLGQVEATDGAKTADITVVDNGSVKFTSAVALNDAGTAYVVTLDSGVTTTISKSYLDAVLVAAQADIDLADDVEGAQDNLADAIIDAVEAQDPDFD